MPRGRLSMGGARILLVSGPDPGHAFPIIGLGTALRERGHEVTVATGRDHEAAIEGEGCRFVELPLLAPSPPSREHDLGHLLWRLPVVMAPALAERVSDRPPDLVVADTLTSAGGFAAELLDRDWVELSPHYLYAPDPHLPPVGLGRRPERWWWPSSVQMRRAQARSTASGRAMEVQARGELGLPTARRRRARLLCTLPALEYPRRRWPGDAHLVGPMGWEPRWAPLPLPAGDGPLVVVTDTTATGRFPSLAATAVEALAGTGVRLVATTGDTELTGWGPGCVVGRGPHRPLLEAADLAVGPGGHGFVVKALAAAVPLVIVPLQGDQRETSMRVRHAGAGGKLEPWRLRPAALRRRVLTALGDPALRAGARRCAAGARGLGPAWAATLVERALA